MQLAIPARIFIETAVLLKLRGPGGIAVHLTLSDLIFRRLQLPNVINRLSKVERAVGKGAMGTIFDTISLFVCFMHAGAGLVVSQVITSLCVTGSSVEKRAAIIERKYF